MKLNETTRTAINFVSALNDKPQGLDEVAKQIGSSKYFVAQIARKLRVAGLVHSIKGPNGGYLKTRQSNAWQIMNAVLTKPIEADPSIYGGVVYRVRETLESIQI